MFANDSLVQAIEHAEKTGEAVIITADGVAVVSQKEAGDLIRKYIEE